MKKNNNFKKREQPKSFTLEYDKVHEAMVLRILDAEGMFPCFVHDPEAGMYKIIKTSSGKLQMCK